MMSLLTFVFFYVLVFVRAVPLVKRIVVSPPITNPTATTTWKVGDQVTVTWDTSSIPPPGNFTGQLVLGYLTTGSENLNINNPLAQGFLLSSGSQQITVPNVPDGSNYIIVLFGDSGNASPQFTITGGSGTTATPSPTSTSTPTPTTPLSSDLVSPPSSPAPSSPSSPLPEPSTSTVTPTSPNPTTPGLPASSSSSGTTSTTSTTGATSSPSNPVAKSSTSNSALPALNAHGASTIFLCAASAAMSLVIVL